MDCRLSRRRLAIAVTCVAGLQVVAASAQQTTTLFDMTIEELGSLRVTSVSRRSESLEQTPTSVYVITAADIRRAGVTSIPEALRLAPGVEVVHNDASTWTISIRGFNSNLSNKLLVLIDGRSVYSPLFAGVFWDVQDTLLADIDRIEVIAGPGGTVWGANAVNGVINIITKPAEETQGAYAEIGGGVEARDFAGVRYGGSLTDNIDARAYVKYFERGSTEQPGGGDAFDQWHVAQAGFKLAWDVTAEDRVTLRGDVYDGEESALLRGDFTLGTLPEVDIPGKVDVSGYNVLGEWRRQIDGQGVLQFQTYLDHTERVQPGSFDEFRDTFDVDFQHDLPRAARHALAWGAGLRVTSDDVNNTLFATFEPASTTDRTLSAFIQDRILFRDDRLVLTLGTKLENNDYTGFEHQPNVRLSFAVNERASFWSAVSRAVRTPARLNTDLILTAPIPGQAIPIYVNVVGNEDFESEDLLAYEAGYRWQATDNLSFDVAVFDNYYENLQTQEGGMPFIVTDPVTYLVIPARLENGMEAETYGGAVVVNWQPLTRFRFRANYTRLQILPELEPGSNDVGGLGIAGNSPRHQLGLFAFGELPRNLSFYGAARYVDELPSQGVESYVAVDANLAWERSNTFRVALTVQNLNDAERIEFRNGSLIERSAYVQFSWSF